MDFRRLSRPSAVGSHEGERVRIYKRTAQSRKWEIQFRDHLYIIRRLTLFTDKAASEEAGRKIEKLVAFKMAGEPCDTTLAKWLGTCSAAILTRLAEWDIVDGRRAASAKGISAHVEDWRATLMSAGRVRRHIADTVSNVNKCIEYCKWRTLGDITGDSVMRYMAHLRTKGKSLSTINHHLRSVKTFCNWLLSECRIVENSVARIPLHNVATDRRKERRALTHAELTKLIQAAESGGIVNGMAGHERALLYRLAAETGLRWSELYSLKKTSFHFDGSSSHVTIQAANAKNRKRDQQPIQERLARDLQSYFDEHPNKEKAFRQCGGKRGLSC